MKRWIIVAAAAGVVAFAVVSSASPGVSRPENAPQADPYGSDRRLQKPLTLEAKTRSLHNAVAAIRAATGVEVMAQGTVATRRVQAHCREVPAAEIMEALASAANLEWRQVEHRWILTDVPELAHLELLDWLTLSRRTTRGTLPLRTLTPRQMETLERRGTLLPEDLTPVQREGLREVAKGVYIEWRGQRSRDILGLRGVFLATAKGHPAVRPGEIGMFFHLADGDEDSNIIAIPGEHVRVIPVAGGPAGMAPPPTPALGTPPVFGPPGQPADLDADNRLNAPLRLRGNVVGDLVRAVGEAPGIDLVVSSEMLLQLSKLVLRPVEVPTAPTVRDGFSAIARATGGSWRKVGGIYVLRTNPRVERAAKLRLQSRPEWLRDALADVHRGIGVTQRRILRETGKLEASQLTDSQREALKWMAALAFVAEPGIDPAALDLTGVSLRYLPPDPPARALPHVEYRIPRLKGGEQVVATLPLT